MKAVICKRLGTPEVLSLETVDSPPFPGPDQVKIAIHACGVNFADTLIIQGKYQLRPEPPFSPGMEVSGEVLECGPGVTDLKVGDRVLAVLSYGGYAEEVVAPAVAVVPLPSNMDFITAAGFPVAYGTSHLALTHRAHLQPGENLLVHGAGGGVGLTAVEIGKVLGATVIATAGGEEKLKVAAEHGADYLIDYAKEDIRDRVKAWAERMWFTIPSAAMCSMPPCAASTGKGGFWPSVSPAARFPIHPQIICWSRTARSSACTGEPIYSAIRN